MPTDDTYKRLVKGLWLEGRLSDCRAGELQTSYVVRRRLFALAGLLAAIAWIPTARANNSWLGIAITTALFSVPFLYCMGQTTSLEHKIDRVSTKLSPESEESVGEFLKPYPDLYRIFLQWSAEGPLWRHDEVRLTEIAQYARFNSSQSAA